MAPLIEFNNELSKFIEFKVNFNQTVQYVFKFDNSYGASVLWWDAGYEVGSSGFDDNLWEVTIIRWVTSDKFTIVLHEIQGNVITRELTTGARTSDEVFRILEEVQNLPDKPIDILNSL